MASLSPGASWFPPAEESSQIRAASRPVAIATPPYRQGQAILQKTSDSFDIRFQPRIKKQQGQGEYMQAFGLFMGDVEALDVDR